MYPTERRGHLCRMQPMAAIPTTRATTLQRMRRDCVNIAANGSSYPPVKRRRRRFVRTIAMATPTMLWNCQDTYGLVDDGIQQMERLTSGQDFSISRTELLANNKMGNGIQSSSQDTLCCDSPRPRTSYSLYENKSVTQHTINELKSIVESLERNVPQEESTKPDREPELRQEDVSFQSSQLHILTNLIRETNEKLDTYILHQAEHNVKMSTSPLMQMNLLGKLKGGRQRRSLPVLPLLVQTLPPPAATSALPQLPAPPYPAGQFEGYESFSNRPRLCRSFPQRDRRRRRPLRSAYIHMENRSCSTDDLEILPRILLARTAAGGNDTITQNFRDCGTTMWCPMNCCREHFSGIAENDSVLPPLEEKDKVLTPIPYPRQPSSKTIETTIKYDYDSPPPLPKTPPPRDRIQKEKVYRVASGSYDISTDGSSSCSSSQEFSYTYMNNRREKNLHEWYSNVDVMEQYCRERKPEVQTSNKELQTEIDSTVSTTSTSDINHHIIATTDKAVGTTELQNDILGPTSIVRQCKSSSLKPQQEKSVSPKNNSFPKARRSEVKVKFERRTNPEVRPKMATVGTHPIFVSSAMQMPGGIQKFKSLDEPLRRKSVGKQETEESTWYRVAGGSYYLPPNKGYPTCWN